MRYTWTYKARQCTVFHENPRDPMYIGLRQTATKDLLRCGGKLCHPNFPCLKLGPDVDHGEKENSFTTFGRVCKSLVFDKECDPKTKIMRKWRDWRVYNGMVKLSVVWEVVPGPWVTRQREGWLAGLGTVCLVLVLAWTGYLRSFFFLHLLHLTTWMIRTVQFVYSRSKCCPYCKHNICENWWWGK